MPVKKTLDIGTAREQAVQFITTNKKAIFIAGLSILVLGFLLVIAAMYYRNLQTNALEPNVDPNYLVLPEKVRTTDTPANTAPSLVDPSVDPFAGPMFLRGIIRGGKGGNLAIIETNGTTFIAEEGSSIAGVWSVLEVRSDAVILIAGDQQLQLEFGGKMSSAKIETQNNAEGEAGIP